MHALFRRQIFAWLAVSVCLLALLSACASNPEHSTSNTGAAVSGELFYRQRIALSPDAVINLRLVDTDSGNVQLISRSYISVRFSKDGTRND